MHELPVTEEILKIVLQYARRHGVTEVKKVFLEIGALSDLEEEWIQRYFRKLASGSVAAGAAIEVKKLPCTFRCGGCGYTFTANLDTNEKLLCPRCGEAEIRMISGDEYTVKSMEAL